MDESVFFDRARGIRLGAAEAGVLGSALRAHMRGNPVREAENTCRTDNMDPREERIIGQARVLRMSPAENEEMAGALRAFVRSHPVGESRRALRVEWLSILQSLRRPFSAVAVSAVFLLAATGSAAYAADSALPGDALYPVKIHVNERVRAALAVTIAAKAKVRAAQAEERLREAERLAALGRIDATMQAKVAAAIESDTARARRTIAHAARENGALAEELDARLESNLSARRAVFTVLAKGNERRPELRALAKSVSHIERPPSRSDAAAGSPGIPDDAARTAAEKMITLAARAIAEVKAQTGPAGTEIAASADATVDLTDARLATAEKLLKEAREKAAVAAFGEALVLARSARKTAREVTVIRRTERELKIPLRVDAAMQRSLERESEGNATEETPALTEETQPSAEPSEGNRGIGRDKEDAELRLREKNGKVEIRGKVR